MAISITGMKGYYMGYILIWVLATSDTIIWQWRIQGGGGGQGVLAPHLWVENIMPASDFTRSRASIVFHRISRSVRILRLNKVIADITFSDILFLSSDNKSLTYVLSLSSMWHTNACIFSMVSNSRDTCFILSFKVGGPSQPNISASSRCLPKPDAIFFPSKHNLHDVWLILALNDCMLSESIPGDSHCVATTCFTSLLRTSYEGTTQFTVVLCEWIIFLSLVMFSMPMPFDPPIKANKSTFEKSCS